MRTSLFIAMLAGAWMLSTAASSAQTTPAQTSADDSGLYTSPNGAPPPVAPPIRKGSALDHLVNDPKVPALPVGYKEGHTTGSDYLIAHRRVDDAGGSGWGWIKKEGQSWSSAQWIALQETPGVAVAPFRKLVSHEADDNWEFKFWGTIAPYKAYDPHLDEVVPVFVLQGYEVIGPENALNIKEGPPGRLLQRPSGASSRSDRPILTDPGVD
jgi:hypothetical protein